MSDQLDEIKQILQISSLDFTSYASAISSLSSSHLDVKRQLLRLDAIYEELGDTLADIEAENDIITKWLNNPAEGESAAVLDRRREALVKQSREYKAQLDAPDVDVTLQALLDQHATNKALEKELKAKKARLEAFRGLPPDVGLARLELARAQDEQMKLFMEREKLLNDMAKSVK